MWGRRSREARHRVVWELGPVERRREDGLERVGVTVGGRPIRFESKDASFTRSTEAFAGLLLLPALDAGAHIRVVAPLDATWVLGTRTLTGIYAEWWGYPAVWPVDMADVRRDDAVPAPGHGLWFTAGVDSFFALLSASSRYDHLVSAHGYDLPLGGSPRAAAWERSLREVARDTGKRAVVVRSDLRRHPYFSSVPWERSHGAALAAVGHLLSSRLGAFSIPSSRRKDREEAWGTHPSTDELWSTHRVRIQHEDAGLPRRDRVLRIAHYAPAQRHLSVCRAARGERPNCSACAECLRTMTALAAAGELRRFETFDRDADLPRAVSRLAHVPAREIPLWDDLLDLDLAPSLARAVEALVRRSRPRGWRRWFGSPRPPV